MEQNNDKQSCVRLHPLYLNAGRSPGDELGQFPLPYPLQTLVDLGGVHLSLNDVEQGDVAMAVPSVTQGGHHHILRLHTEVGGGRGGGGGGGEKYTIMKIIHNESIQTNKDNCPLKS